MMITVFLAAWGYDMPTIERMIEGDLKNTPIFSNGITPRHLMQTLGTEWGRHCVYENMWVDLTMDQATRVMETGVSVVIDDMRFPNEFEAITDRGGRTWEVIRPDATPKTDHPSEGLLSGYDFDTTIMNDGTLEELRRETVCALKGE